MNKDSIHVARHGVLLTILIVLVLYTFMKEYMGRDIIAIVLCCSIVPIYATMITLLEFIKGVN